ncbi:MAG: hypothetical protein Q8N84_02925 [bacterium]|nr:hypothetical protein [bacterium]
MTCRKNSSKPSSAGERGSALLIIVGVLAVLTVAGLAYSARSISTVKQTAHSTQSDQAYACAEAGAEEALGKLEADEDVSACTKANPCQGELKAPQDSTKTLCSFAYSVGQDPEAGANSYSFILEQDLTAQINLQGVAAGTLANVYWYKSGEDTGTCGGNPNKAALLYALVYYQAPGGYQMAKAIYDPCSDRSSNGFAAAEAGEDPYSHGLSITMPNHDVSKPVLLRLRALYAGTHAMIKVAGVALPEQGKLILSTGRAGEASVNQVSVRQVEVKRSNPALPTIFDYVLFSGANSPLPQ